MKTNKLGEKVTLLVIMIALLSITIISAQEKDNGIMKEPKKGEGINKGTVVAFGENLKYPYHVIWDDGKILINGIVFSPREQDLNIKREDIKVTEMQIRRYNLEKSISRKYVEYYNDNGEMYAIEKIIKDYKDNAILKKLNFNKKYLILEFIDGHIEWMNMESFIKADKDLYPIKKENEATRRRQIQKLRARLEQNGVLAFGYRYTIYTNKQTYSEVENVIMRVKNGQYSVEKASDDLIELLGPQAQEFFDDVKSQIDCRREQ